uniref:Uncharacterized protein n=1 Tax=Panagrolaimus sp. JU765 TaxID=591449 RepID=A0AC34RI22_9BILA
MPIGFNKVTGVNKKRDKKRFTDSTNNSQNEVKINGIEQQRVDDINMGNNEASIQHHNRISFSKSAKNGVNDLDYWKALLENKCEAVLETKQGLKEQLQCKTSDVAIVDAGPDTETSMSNNGIIVDSKKKKVGKKKLKKLQSNSKNSVEEPTNDLTQNDSKTNNVTHCESLQNTKMDLNETAKLEIPTSSKECVDFNVVAEESNALSSEAKNDDLDEMILVQRKRRSKVKAPEIINNKVSQNNSAVKGYHDQKPGRRNDGKNRTYSDKKGSYRYNNSKLGTTEKNAPVARKSASFDLESDFPPLSVEKALSGERRNSNVVNAATENETDQIVQTVEAKVDSEQLQSNNDVIDTVEEKELPSVSLDASSLTGKDEDSSKELPIENQNGVETDNEQSGSKVDTDTLSDNLKEDVSYLPLRNTPNHRPRHFGHHGHRKQFEVRPQMSNIYPHVPAPTGPGRVDYNVYANSLPMQNHQILRPNFYLNQPRHPIPASMAYAAFQPTLPHYSSGFLPHQSLLPVQLPISSGAPNAFSNGHYSNVQPALHEYPVMPLMNQFPDIQHSYPPVVPFPPDIHNSSSEDLQLFNNDNPSRESTPRADHAEIKLPVVNSQINPSNESVSGDQKQQNADSARTVIPVRAPPRVDTLCFSPELQQTIRDALGLHPNEGIFYVYTVDSNSNHYRQFRCLMHSTTPVKFDGISFPVTLEPNYGMPGQLSPAGYYYVAREPSSAGTSSDSNATLPPISTHFMPVSSFSATVPEEYRIPPLPHYYENLLRVPETSNASVPSNNATSGASNVTDQFYPETKNLPNGSLPGSN